MSIKPTWQYVQHTVPNLDYFGGLRENVCTPLCMEIGRASHGEELITMSENNGKVEHRYYFSDSQAGKDICDRRIATVKSHIRCYINEGHDIKSAGDLRLLLILTVVSKGAR